MCSFLSEDFLGENKICNCHLPTKHHDRWVFNVLKKYTSKLLLFKRLRRIHSLNTYPKFNGWNLKMMISHRNLLFQGLIFRFHVKTSGVYIFSLSKRKDTAHESSIDPFSSYSYVFCLPERRVTSVSFVCFEASLDVEKSNIQPFLTPH